MGSKDMIGILLNHWEWKKIIEGTSHEHIDLYLQAAQKYNVNICFFRLRDISRYYLIVRGTMRVNSRWVQKVIPLPKVIHNRAIFKKKRTIKTIKNLENAGHLIYNFWNGYEKLFIYQILKNNPGLRAFLPDTRAFSKASFLHFMKKSSFMLKPDRGSRGDGILRVQRVSNSHWEVRYVEEDILQCKRVNQRKLYSYLKEIMGQEKYIIQETIDLLKAHHSPFDIRVSVQKDGHGQWQVPGMVGKVAGRGGFLSNVAKGGTVHRLEDLIAKTHLEPLQLKCRLAHLALELVNYLEPFIPNLADVGFDFGLDTQGKPYLIEMNGRDQRYSFMLAGMEDAFQLTYENPIAYGCTLLRLLRAK